MQGAIEEAIFRFCGQKANLHGAGRTDRGVHALAQRAHVDLDLARYPSSANDKRNGKRNSNLLGNLLPETILRDALNAHLREHLIAVREVVVVASDFHARFSALSRSYLYRVVISPHRPILREGRVWHRRLTRHAQARQQARFGKRGLLGKLDFLRELSLQMLGKHDFSAFRAAGCQSPSAVKDMQRIEIELRDDELRFSFCASGFLYRQVRLMVGTLVAIGEGRLGEEVLKELLDLSTSSSPEDLRRLRRLVPAPAPACGLYFTGVEY